MTQEANALPAYAYQNAEDGSHVKVVRTDEVINDKGALEEAIELEWKITHQCSGRYPDADLRALWVVAGNVYRQHECDDEACERGLLRWMSLVGEYIDRYGDPPSSVVSPEEAEEALQRGVPVIEGLLAKYGERLAKWTSEILNGPE